MTETESIVFQYFSKELQDILTSESKTDEVANSLYQSEGVISLDNVLHIKALTSEAEKARHLLSLLQQLILEDKSQFEKIAGVLKSHAELSPTVIKTKEKICELDMKKL